MDGLDTDEFRWTTGNLPNISHVKKIDSGSFGEVHKVKTSHTTAADVVVDEKCGHGPGN
jgi:hypothetical protein